MLADFVAVDPSLDVAAKHVFRKTFPQAQKASLAAVKVMTPYKGAGENGLFLTVAAQLANRASNWECYLQWAWKQWDRFQGTGMINEH